MGAGVQAGLLGRWFEELCRLKHEKLQVAVSPYGSNYRMQSGQVTKSGGVYAFWWTGPTSSLKAATFNRELNLHGPGSRTVPIEVDDEWLGLEADLPVPLYVGKSAKDLSSRIGKHLCLDTPSRIFPSSIGRQRHKAPTTSCQLRAGVEHHFLKETTPVELILENIGVSYVALDGDMNAANRFYLEDMAIGLMRPPFNVDIER